MLIKVKVFPDSSGAEVEKRSEDSFIVKVKSKPVGGRATEEMLIELSCFLGIPASKIRVIKGFKTRNKILEILP